MRPADRMNGIRRIAAVFAVAACVGFTSRQTHVQSGPVLHPYQGVDDWAKLPDGRTWGAPAGVEMDPDQTSLWVFERCGANSCAESDVPAILKFDASGNLVQSFGAGMFIFPHGLHVDHEGSVYVTDGRGDDSRGHQVFKFSPDGELLFTLGLPVKAPARSIGRPMSQSLQTATSSWPTDTVRWIRTCGS